PESIRMSSAFGGGMCIEEKCGAVTGALMIIGYMFVENCAHKSEIMKPVVHSFLMDFELELQSSICLPLKAMYRTEESGCQSIIEKSLEILERTIEKYLAFRIR
ncbi:MAG: C_GCAxxG_C_C family protein, partial [Clostridia bacterium]|nr:C_GCAxxG_C_C family protein [Clostridia bacterium]